MVRRTEKKRRRQESVFYRVSHQVLLNLTLEIQNLLGHPGSLCKSMMPIYGPQHKMMMMITKMRIFRPNWPYSDTNIHSEKRASSSFSIYNDIGKESKQFGSIKGVLQILFSFFKVCYAFLSHCFFQTCTDRNKVTPQFMKISAENPHISIWCAENCKTSRGL